MNYKDIKKVTYIPSHYFKGEYDELNYMVVTFAKDVVRYTVMPVGKPKPTNCKIDVVFKPVCYENKDYLLKWTVIQTAAAKLDEEIHASDMIDNYLPTEVCIELNDGKRVTFNDCDDDGTVEVIRNYANCLMPGFVKDYFGEINKESCEDL